MKSVFFLFSILLAVQSFGQESLSSENAKIIINIFMDGYRAGDTLKMKSVMHPNMTMNRAYVNTEQENILMFIRASELLTYAATTGKEQVWDEKLTDYIVNSDGNIAHVWSPYEYYLNGKFSHCGANSFTLVYTDESWKILRLIDSLRIGSCKIE
ncbi:MULTISPECIES: nuclear transport factor 2 family protein [Aequorivita]|uniref:Nuclear transport factor 2 family protein n=1 Tax=Aequorivita iocasae TaxID=2803865 RepID=A0ABX7DPA2_9FLAO|nr:MULTISPECIES: nuclear transport factor 2 family protein [Aequorivita]QQX75899.1 nuclear transport factor 2 family protein [Aequorivita iocasae]UCA55361.1 nuclear transport factor 2 family protein [Aequorivita sp. F7]